MLNNYEKCAFMGKYLWDECGTGRGYAEDNETKSKYTEVGIVFHEVMEEYQKQHKQGNKMSLDELHMLIDSKLDKVEDELFEDLDEKENYRISLHEQMNWLYTEQNDIFETVPFGIEQDFNIDLEIDGIKLPFVGCIDRVDLVEGKTIHLKDWKTGRVYTKKELASNMQACVYSLAIYKIYGVLPEEFSFYFTKFHKVKTIKITPLFIETALKRIKANYDIMMAEVQQPNDKNKFFCKHFCEVYKQKGCPNFRYAKKQNNGWDNVREVK